MKKTRWLLAAAFLFLCGFPSGVCGSLRSDLNGDGKVNLADFAIFAGDWLSEENNAMSGYLWFNGETARFSVADDASLNFGTGDFSISFWAKPVDSTGFGAAVVKQYEGAGYVVGVSTTRGYAIFDIFDGSKRDSFESNSEVAIGSWSYYAFTADRDGKLSIYINGVLDKQISCTATGSLDNNKSMFLFVDGGSPEGSFDSLRLYKKCLSPTEVAAIYAAGRTNPYSAAAGEGGKASAVFEFEKDQRSTILTDEAALTGVLTNEVAIASDSPCGEGLGPNLVKNWYFPGGYGWEVDGDKWTVYPDDNKVTMSKAEDESILNIHQLIPLKSSTQYRVSATVSDLSAGVLSEAGGKKIRVRLFGATDDELEIFDNGTYSKTITTNSGLTDPAYELRLACSANLFGDALSFSMTDIHVCEVLGDGGCCVGGISLIDGYYDEER